MTMENIMKRQSQKHRPTKTLRCDSDCSFPNPGQYLVVYCGVCGKSMIVRRNVLGPTGFAEAMLVQSGQSPGHLHDAFRCEDREEHWHRQAKAIRDQARESPSKRLADLLIEEANEIVRTRKITRQGW
jgi:hypothetical protein